MNPEVQEYIDSKQREVDAFLEKQNQEELKVKEEKIKVFLERAGLARKVYEDEEASESDAASADDLNEKYPHSEYDGSGFKRYRWEYPDYTDEEIEQMQEAQERVDALRSGDKKKQSSEEKQFTSGLAIFLTGLAVVVFIAAFIAGIVLARKEVLVGTYYTYTKEEFDAGLAFLYWGAGLISGSLMLGLAHIVEHLNRQTELLKALVNKK